ncbi:uncharacterized protein LOC113229908 [Hyposmocoma kahamanoa]|uniref:uncharacterized protein LOC113229908 n=1 Tax=Hyposmocoma kahamanoa TaxID=1477025 RepID=UPI000E6D6A6F|nr:uncharacterized protein LOC113229908 [Hyposmocoma kahamanoa]
MIMAQSLKANVDLGPHQYDITPESAHSAVLLLKSEEPEILRNTLLAIAQFAKQDKRNKEPSNCQLLLDLDAIQYILPHIGHNELSIRRCALKNLALLCHLPRGREQVLEDPESLRRIVSLFCTMEDIFILEFASLILSEVTKELNGCEQLLAANILSVIFNRMKNCPDPDVQMNSLQIISNLTADPARASVIAQDPQFSWPSILSLLPNKYVAIQQAAIATVEQLVSRYQDPVIQKSFRDSTGVLDLCSSICLQEGFYVQKRLDDYFPTIAKIHETTIPPSHWQPVYVVMFNPVDCQPLSAVDIIRNPHKVSTSNIKLITSASVFLPKVEDVNLRTYLLKLKMWFGDPTQSMLDLGAEDSIYDVRYREMCTEVSSALKERAQLLAEYVCEVMSGRSQNRDCSVSGVNLHLADLMTYLNTPVLGLGWIQVGGALERALLYKVLADRIGLPCSFYRAAGAHAWCEVAVPDLPIKQLEEEEDNIPLYPSGLLRVNYVVDLTLQQGKLFPVGSVEARRICGPKGAPLYVARRPRNCNCLSKNSKLSVKDK